MRRNVGALLVLFVRMKVYNPQKTNSVHGTHYQHTVKVKGTSKFSYLSLPRISLVPHLTFDIFFPTLLTLMFHQV